MARGTSVTGVPRFERSGAMAGRKATLEFLGTGTSTGVPVAGCDCEVCRSRDPRDNRLRSSVLVSHGHKNVIIDTGPEFRMQCLRARIMHLDAVLLTHDHADHLHGLDDLRAFSKFQRRVLPVWANRQTLQAIESRFAYIWNPPQIGGGLPELTLQLAEKPFRAAGLDFIPVPIMHGRLPILGYRIGDLAYLTDVSAIPEESFPLLEGLGTLILSCVRYRSHRTHLNIAGVKRISKRLKPERTFLTHLTHYFSHEDLLAEFDGMPIAPAYDGMRISVAL